MTERLSDTFAGEVLNRAAIGDQKAFEQLLAMGPAGEEARMATLLAQHLLKMPENISDDLRAALIARMAPHGVDALDETRSQIVYELIAGVDLEKHLERIDQTLKTYLYPSLATSEFFNDALKNWDAWSVDEKIAYGQKFAQSFSRIASTRFMTESAGVVAEEMIPSDGKAAFGVCRENSKTGRCSVVMNTYENAAFANQKDFDETLYHELMHTVQKGLARLARMGHLNDVPAELRTSATLMSVMNTHMFYLKIRDNLDMYGTFPMEAHAENNARNFGAALHDPVKRENLIARHSMKMQAGGFTPYKL